MNVKNKNCTYQLHVTVTGITTCKKQHQKEK